MFQQGKDVILDALASLCSCCHVAITAEDSSLPSVILNAVCAACSRKSKLYREAAFLCLHKVLFFNSHLIFAPIFTSTCCCAIFLLAVLFFSGPRISLMKMAFDKYKTPFNITVKVY